MKKYLKWIICILSLIIFLFLTYLVITKKDLRIDGIVYNFISQFIKSQTINPANCGIFNVFYVNQPKPDSNHFLPYPNAE